ncbi:LLM class flavin-dependent oxidoreductase [Ensifer soli]|uniref:LLM class flavin-dependent oxidoreductase n=1 Tax=Ciceribacter sp. sgz301302 TaxID=3342379 RepID=UPI0035B8662B
MTRQLHLGLNVLSDGMHPAAWQAPEADALGFLRPEQWNRLAELAEKATLDAIFLADLTNLSLDGDKPLGGPPLSLDPIVLLSSLASKTTHVGLAATVSTSFEEPYTLARRISSLDHLSKGRAAWNVVTSADGKAAANFGGKPFPPREERYARAEEFVDVVRALWDSWSDDALAPDKATGAFTRRGSIRPIDFKGRYYSVEGPLNVPRAPQGHPVLIQAGGSNAGLNLAARQADAVFAALATLEDAHAYAADLKARTRAFGRPEHAVKILPGLSFVLGGTEAEARARNDLLNSLAGERRLAWLAWQIGVDPSDLAWDAPLPASLLEGSTPSPGSQGARDIVLNVARRKRLTVRQLLDRILTWHRLVVGTPEQLAATIEEWFLSGAVDGFNLMPDVQPSGFEAFVDHVVPILRRRGLFRSEYRGTTLREHFGIPRPQHRFLAS